MACLKVLSSDEIFESRLLIAIGKFRMMLGGWLGQEKRHKIYLT